MTTAEQGRVGIIGGGLAGLTAACTLAARGYGVTLFERNSWLGGKAAVWERDGFRFDMGPTILTLPSVLRRVFQEAGKSLDEHLDLVRLDPQWRCFFEDGSTLDLTADIDRMCGDLNEYTGRDDAGDKYRKFMHTAERMHAIAEKFYFYRNVGGLRDALSWTDWVKPSTLADLLALRMNKSVAGLVRSYVSDERVAQMIDHFTQYVGSAPDNSPAVLCGIAHMQTDEGVWYPRGGTGMIPQALGNLAAELGVTVHRDRQVTKIVVEDGRAVGVETADDTVHEFDAVVSNSDIVRSHDELLDGDVRVKFQNRREYEPACSGVVLYLGLKERYEHILHHDFVFSRDPEEEFEFIYRKGEPAPDPTCYVCAPACTDPGVAPDGGEALYVLVHTPHLRPHHDWGKMLPKYRQVILDKLKRTAGMADLEDRIVCQHTLTPEDIHRRYHVLNGAIYGLASHGLLWGGFKPANRSPDVKGLYFAGGSAHPGPGMPMVMMSGWIAADTLDKDQLPTKQAVGVP